MTISEISYYSTLKASVEYQAESFFQYGHLAGVNESSSSCLLHHALELSIVSGVGGVGDDQIVDTIPRKNVNPENKSSFHI